MNVTEMADPFGEYRSGGPLCGCDGCETVRSVLDLEELTPEQVRVGGALTELRGRDGSAW